VGIFRRGDKVDVIVFDNGLKELSIGKAVRDGNVIIDGMIGRQYPIVTPPLILRNGKKKKLVYLLDAERGCTVELERDDELLNLKTNPDLVGKVLDSRLIQQAFAIKPETRQIIAALIVGMGIGWFIGLFF